MKNKLKQAEAEIWREAQIADLFKQLGKNLHTLWLDNRTHIVDKVMAQFNEDLIKLKEKKI
jgi:hypothetical protein